MIKKIFMLSCLSILACSKEDNAELEPKEEDSSTYAFTYNGKDYEVVKESMTWLAAVSYAAAKGGYLAEIDDAEEDNALFLELSSNASIVLDNTNNQFGFAAVWLGANDLDSEGVWVWDGNNDKESRQFWSGAVDGTPVDGLYNNWGKEPDNNGDQDALCVGLEATPINDSGKWTDLDGATNKLFFVIEYD